MTASGREIKVIGGFLVLWILVILILIAIFAGGCGSGVGQSSGNFEQDRTDVVYEICLRLPYADDYMIGLLIRATREARSVGISDMETLSTLADSCDQSCFEPNCDPPTCNECMIAIVDLVYWNHW